MNILKKTELETEYEIEKICCNCEFATAMEDGNSCICKKNGVVRSGDTCKKFKFDLLKLKPDLPLLPDQSKSDLFSI